MAAPKNSALLTDIEKKGGNNKPIKEKESSAIVQAKTFGACWSSVLCFC